jgi:hypothetical protein
LTDAEPATATATVFPLNDAAQAHEHLMTQAALGKCLLDCT